MHVRETLSVSERRACRVLGQVRRTQRYTPKIADDEEDGGQFRSFTAVRALGLAVEVGHKAAQRKGLLKTFWS